MNILMVITLDGSAEIKDQEIVHVIEKSYADQLKAERDKYKASWEQLLAENGPEAKYVAELKADLAQCREHAKTLQREMEQYQGIMKKQLATIESTKAELAAAREQIEKLKAFYKQQTGKKAEDL